MIENTNYYWNLINRAQQGQKKPFLELASFYKNMVFQHALRLNGNIGYAEKVTNDVFIKAWQHIKYLTESSPFNLWLNGLTVSISASFHQIKNKSEFASDQNKDLVLANEFDREFIKLTETQRLLLILHDLEGYAIADCSIMLNENKVPELEKDLEEARTKFISANIIGLLNSYPDENWRKITQDFEYWISEIKSDDDLTADLAALKNYREILTNFLSKNKPSENLLRCLTSILSDESKLDERNRRIEESILSKATNSTKDNNTALTDDVAEIFSNPEDAKEQFSKKLNLIKKQKRFVSNLSYLLVIMNAIVLFFVISNIFQKSTWESTSTTQMTASFGTSNKVILNVEDIVETELEEKSIIDIHSVGKITLGSNTKIKVESCEANNNILQLIDGNIEIKTKTFFKRLSFNLSDYTIEDFGSSSSITYQPKIGRKKVEVSKGNLTAYFRDEIIPIPEGYNYYIGEISSFRNSVTNKYREFISQLKTPLELDNKLNYLLQNSTKKDCITLWVLLNNSDNTTNRIILNKIVSFFNLPSNVTQSGLLKKDKIMMEKLLEHIEWQI